jgi:IS1 family transposase
LQIIRWKSYFCKMLFNGRQTNSFIFSAVATCAAVLFIVFASYRSTASIEFLSEKKAGFSSSLRVTDDFSLYSAPVNVPSPAVFAKKGHSSRISIVAKFIQAIPQTLWIRYASLSLTKVVAQHFQPLRLHLALRVLRI